jgi:hypothetical protein
MNRSRLAMNTATETTARIFQRRLIATTPYGRNPTRRRGPVMCGR